MTAFYDFKNQSDLQIILSNGQYVDSKNYFVALSKEDKKINVQVNPIGEVFFFKQL